MVKKGKIGIYSSVSKSMVFGICEENKAKAWKKLENRIGWDSAKYRFKAKAWTEKDIEKYKEHKKQQAEERKERLEYRNNYVKSRYDFILENKNFLKENELKPFRKMSNLDIFRLWDKIKSRAIKAGD